MHNRILPFCFIHMSCVQRIMRYALALLIELFARQHGSAFLSYCGVFPLCRIFSKFHFLAICCDKGVTLSPERFRLGVNC